MRHSPPPDSPTADFELPDWAVTAPTPDAIADAVATRGWCVAPGFVGGAALQALVAAARDAWAAGEYRPAGVGRGVARRVQPEVRGDHVLWLQPPDVASPVAAYLGALEPVRVALNRALYLGLFDFEGHLAVYPPGTFYRKHVDRFRDASERQVTAILYLNPGWTAADGGCLRLFLDPAPEVDAALPELGGESGISAPVPGASTGQVDPAVTPGAAACPLHEAAATHLERAAPCLDIPPRAGTLVVFLAPTYYHEVLPAHAERAAITGWFRRRPLGL